MKQEEIEQLWKSLKKENSWYWLKFISPSNPDNYFYDDGKRKVLKITFLPGKEY